MTRCVMHVKRVYTRGNVLVFILPTTAVLRVRSQLIDIAAGSRGRSVPHAPCIGTNFAPIQLEPIA